MSPFSCRNRAGDAVVGTISRPEAASPVTSSRVSCRRYDYGEQPTTWKLCAKFQDIATTTQHTRISLQHGTQAWPTVRGGRPSRIFRVEHQPKTKQHRQAAKSNNTDTLPCPVSSMAATHLSISRIVDNIFYQAAIL